MCLCLRGETYSVFSDAFAMSLKAYVCVLILFITLIALSCLPSLHSWNYAQLIRVCKPFITLDSVC